MNNLSSFLMSILPDTQYDVCVKTSNFDEFKRVLMICDSFGMKWGDGLSPFESNSENTYFYYDEYDCYLCFCYEPPLNDFRIYICETRHCDEKDTIFESVDEFINMFMSYNSKSTSCEVGNLL